MTSTNSAQGGELNQLMKQGIEALPTDALPTKPKTPGRNKPRSASNLSSSPSKPAGTKSDLILKKLRGRKGVTIGELTAATNWQAHSVRGFLSGTVRKKLALNLTSEVGKDGK